MVGVLGKESLLKLYCQNCDQGEEFVATALLYSDVKVESDGWPAEDYDDLAGFHKPLVEDAVAEYTCIICDAILSPIYESNEESDGAIADLHILRRRLNEEVEAIDNRLEKEARE